MVATIPGTDWMLSSQPTAGSIALGILFHQWADFSWALFFFGVLGTWTARLAPLSLLALALPWAVATSALEWFVLVPLFPFWQPIFTLQQPYWVGVLVHLASASLYPMFTWMHAREVPNRKFRSFLQIWAAGAILGIVLLALAAMAASAGRELPWLGRDPVMDQTFMRHMVTHHEQGIELAAIASERATDAHLRRLADLMTASQRGENKILESWWANWFAVPMQVCSTEERARDAGASHAIAIER